jgi:hypothetical protein
MPCSENIKKDECQKLGISFSNYRVLEIKKKSRKNPEGKKLHRGTKIRITLDCSKIMQTRRKWSENFKVLRGIKNYQPVLQK